MSLPIECFALDVGRHEYLKVHIDDLNSLGLIPLISDDSFVGDDEDDELNEYKYAYLESDVDWGRFIKAAEFFNKEVVIDYDKLQETFDEQYDDYHDWMENLAGCFDEESISDCWDIVVKQPSIELQEHLKSEDDYDDYDDYDEEEEEED
jgi:hypothetical protein